MDKGILKMVYIIIAISITLLLGSMCLAMYSGRQMIQSTTTSDQTSQDNGTGVSDSSSSINQNKNKK